jgi:hypothetical protein
LQQQTIRVQHPIDSDIPRHAPTQRFNQRFEQNKRSTPTQNSSFHRPSNHTQSKERDYKDDKSFVKHSHSQDRESNRVRTEGEVKDVRELGSEKSGFSFGKESQTYSIDDSQTFTDNVTDYNQSKHHAATEKSEQMSTHVSAPPEDVVSIVVDEDDEKYFEDCSSDEDRGHFKRKRVSSGRHHKNAVPEGKMNKLTFIPTYAPWS